MSRLSEIVVGLQRVAEAAQARGDDIRYTQQQETYEHIQWLDQQLNMVEKVRFALLAEKKKFMPVQAGDQIAANQHRQEPVPRIVAKGPAS